MSALFKLKDHFKENKLYVSRSAAIVAIAAALFTILIIRQFYLQVIHHDAYASLARNNQIRMVAVTPTRGLIYDRNGVLLAENTPEFSLEVMPHSVRDMDALLSNLSQIVEIKEDDIRNFQKQKKYKGRFERIAIKNKLTEAEVAAFSVEKYRFPEIEIRANLARHYPFGAACAHIVGYTGLLSEQDLSKIDVARYRGTYVIGKYGIEKRYEELLHGKTGYEQVETDARGRMVRYLDQIPAIEGKNIYLTIDVKLQMLAYDALQNFKGAVVAMDVNTGEVLAMVSKPSFDPDLFARGISQEAYQNLQRAKERPLFHRAIRGQYPPGSTVKPLVALQALDLNVIGVNTRFNDPGYYQLNSDGRYYRDWRPEGHGVIGVEHAIAESCTTFFYFVADKLGIDRMHDIFSKFGLGSLTNIDLEGESAGIAPSVGWKRKAKRQSWYRGETLITGIGQGYTLVTPLQMASVASTIATRGKRVQPHLLRATTERNKLERDAPTVVQEIALNHPEYWDTVIKAMEQVVKHPNGTAHWIDNPRATYTMAGKTGTVQVYGIKQDETYDANKIKSDLRDHAWFIAFAPIEKPQIAVAVVIENSKGSPMVARKILDAYFAGVNHESQ